MERVTGIEPALSAWEADVLPLNYTRVLPPDASTQSAQITRPDRCRPDIVPEPVGCLRAAL
jgi:hypothetical protein